MAYFLQFLVNGIIAGSVLTLNSLGFSLIYAVCGHFHIAQAGVFAISAYTVYTCIAYFQLPLILSILVAAIAAGILGLLINKIVYEPMTKLGAGHLVIFISSLGTLTIIENALHIGFGSDPLFIDVGGLKASMNFWGVIVNGMQIGVVCVAVLCWLGLHLFLYKTPRGREMIATANNPELAEVVGINVLRVYGITYIVASLVIVPAAAYHALDFGAVPHGGILIFLLSAVAVFMGGVGSLTGTVVVAYALAIVQNLTIWKLPSEWENGIIFFLFLILIILRPTGLLGRKENLQKD